MSIAPFFSQVSWHFEPELIAEIDRFASVRTVSAGTVLMEPGYSVLFVPIVLKRSPKTLRCSGDSDTDELLL